MENQFKMIDEVLVKIKSKLESKIDEINGIGLIYDSRDRRTAYILESNGAYGFISKFEVKKIIKEVLK